VTLPRLLDVLPLVTDLILLSMSVAVASGFGLSPQFVGTAAVHPEEGVHEGEGGWRRCGRPPLEN